MFFDKYKIVIIGKLLWVQNTIIGNKPTSGGNGLAITHPAEFFSLTHSLIYDIFQNIHGSMFLP